MKHKRHAVGRLLRAEIKLESDVKVVGQVDLVVEGHTSCLVLCVGREREGVGGGLVARRSIDRDVLVDRRDIKNAAVMRVWRAGRRTRLEGRIEGIDLDLMQGAQAASRAGEAEVGVVRAAEVAGKLRRRQLQLSDLDAAVGVRERLGRGAPMHNDVVPLTIRQVGESDLGTQAIGRGARVGRDEIRMRSGDITLLDVLIRVELDGQAVAQASGAEPTAAPAKGIGTERIVVENKRQAVGAVHLLAHEQAE